MKIVGILLICLGVILLGVLITQGVLASYTFNRDIGCYWDLSDKSSTISQKSDYIDKFVSALENSGLQGQNDALFLFTPNNSFDRNLEALKTLQERLREIKTMDIGSFQYQTAIQQITAQEQGEASAMICVLEGCWWKVHQHNLWSIWGVFLSLFNIGVVITGIAILIAAGGKDSY